MIRCYGFSNAYRLYSALYRCTDRETRMKSIKFPLAMIKSSIPQRPPADKILSMMPEDGSQILLSELRTTAMKTLHMSPSTLSDGLRSLEIERFVKRIVDTTTRPPRVYYERRFKTRPAPSQVELDDWLEPRLRYMRSLVRSALADIVSSPQMKPQDLETLRWITSSALSRLAWITLSDCQKLVKAKRIIGADNLREEAIAEMTEAVTEWEDNAALKLAEEAKQHP
jgi:DNA-binding HxlR family transcriptional regulator